MRRGLAVVAVLCLACQREPSGTGAAAEVEEVGQDTGDTAVLAPPVSTVSGQPPARAWESAAIRGITAPEGDLTFRMDPFIAAALFEWVRGGADPMLQEWTSNGEDGAPRRGYVLGTIGEESLLHRLGLRTGDVIESLARTAFEDPAQLELALEGAENELSVGIYRDGMSIVHSYRLSGGLAWREMLADVGPEVNEEEAAAGTDEIVEEVIDRPGGTAPAPRPSSPSTGSASKRPSASGAGSSPPSPRPSPSGGSASDGVAWCESSEKCFVRESFFDQITASPDRLDAHATIVPAVRNDVFSGYKFKSVKSGGAVSRLGFVAGDKITHINGRDLADDAQALQLYLSMGSTRLFKIRYERNGQRRTKTVLVK